MKYRRIYQTLEQYGAKITYDGRMAAYWADQHPYRPDKAALDCGGGGKGRAAPLGLP